MLGSLVLALVALQISWLAPAPPPRVGPDTTVGTELFRDGARWVTAVRDRSDPTRVVLSYGAGRRARAQVGTNAIVRLAADGADLAEVLAAGELALVRPLFPAARLYLVRSLRAGEDGLGLAVRLAADGAFDVTPDFAFRQVLTAIDVPPNDPRLGGQWYLDRIGIRAAWARETGDASVVVAIVDNGCDLAHPDLLDHMEPGRDLVDGDDTPAFFPDRNGNEHGTACAGLVAAVGDNGIGIAGTCPECHLRCIRLLSDNGAATLISTDVEAYATSLERGDAVSSNSWGFTERIPVPMPLAEALETLIAEGRGGLGTVVVFAAANDAREIFNDELYGIAGVVTVGAINQFDEAASFSNHGGPVDLVAPAGTLTTDISGVDGGSETDYTSLFGGTSSAAPVVAGVAALLVAAAPEKTAAEIVAALVTTARPAPFATPDANGHDVLYGYGVVDPAAAMAVLVPVEVEVGPESGGDIEFEGEGEFEAESEAEFEFESEAEFEAEAEPEAVRGSDDGCAGGSSTENALLVALALVLIGLGGGRGSSARAAEPPPVAPAPPASLLDDGSVDTIPVVVTGTRSESAQSDSPVAVQVLSRAAIEASGARTAADALDGVLGVAIRRSFRGAGLEVQGLSAKHVLVLIDGQRVTGKTDEELDLSRFAADSIERIEIVKGAASALYGSDAIGGVIQIFTRRAPRKKPQGEVEILLGEGGRAVLDGRVGIAGKTLSGALSFGLHRDDPYSLNPASPGTTGSGTDDVGTTLRLDWRPSQRVQIDSRVAHMYRELAAIDATELPPGLDGEPRYRRVDRVDHLHTLDVRIAPRIQLTLAHSLEFALSTSQVWSTLIQDQRGGTQYDRRQVSSEQLYALDAKWTWRASDRHEITAGLEGNFERLLSERLTHEAPDRGRVAVYAQDIWQLLGPANASSNTDAAGTESTPRLVLVPGARADIDTQFGAAVTPRLAVRFDPWKPLTMRLGGGLGFRAPGFRELYLSFENASVGYQIVGNPKLAPERSINVDTGLDVRPNDAWTITVNLFRHDIDDLINYALTTTIPGQSDTYTYVNIASATSQGLEGSVAFAPSRAFGVTLGYGLTDSRDDATGLTVVGRATHQGTLDLRATVAFLDLSTRAELVGPRPLEHDDGTRYQSDPVFLLDARIAAHLGGHLTLVLGADNLTDAGDPTMLPLRPRTIYGGLRGQL